MAMEKLVLAEDQVFLVSDELGDVPHNNTQGLGLYYLDTRFLSIFEFTINGAQPILLNSSSEQNFMGNLQLTNPPLTQENGELINPQSISVRRNRFIDGGLQERLGLFNYKSFPIPVELSLILGADFKDMFEVRGMKREVGGTPTVEEHRGQILTPIVGDSTISLRYIGLDGIERRTEITFEYSYTRAEILPGGEPEVICAPPSASTTATVSTSEPRPPCVRLVFQLVLQPHKPYAITFYVIPTVAGEQPKRASFDAEAKELRESYEQWLTSCTQIRTDNEIFDRMVNRGEIDLRALLNTFPTGLFPTAGIPWFAAPFGRDALITSLQTLILNPDIAVGTLRFLSQHQGKEVNEWRDEQPGKILHEIRRGEMATYGQIPHIPYYGSIDATPLFLILFAEVMDWLDDTDLYSELLPAVKKALDWIDSYGDLDGDGYVEYRTLSRRGLRNQAWKDSWDSYVLPDGSLAEPPIAAVEVQGYVYDAEVRLATLFGRRGEGEWADRLITAAQRLKAKFNVDFWLEEEQFYAQGLDGLKRPIPAVTSNVGHCLWSGIIEPGRARLVVERLMAEDMFSGWGIRTLSSHYPNFNPMSYHNGSIWPHDNSLIAAGMKRYGFDGEANQVINGIFQAGLRFRYNRLPELFCGFQRDLRYFSMPGEYPISCSPQAWATGGMIFLAQTLLGLRPDAANGRLYLRPTLPQWLARIDLYNLRLGEGKVNLLVTPAQVNLEDKQNRFQVLLGHEPLRLEGEQGSAGGSPEGGHPFWVGPRALP
ncbi:MAG: amylo-alpha-1,6-glucosidase [Chloroflexi bacterium]|nr:amylo-alpha-1,6-glucosidase [Chloroflexota bacterium]MCL5074529.1 amylo-alpha-1,6-glucosidase [Chloroflexota bacterium]